MRRSTKFAIALGFLGALVGTASEFALPYGRTRLRESIIARCTVVTGGAACEVAKVQLARDGVVVTGIRIRMPMRAQVVASIGALAIQFDWWPLILGRGQSVGIRVSGAVIEDDAPLEDVIREVERLRRLRRVAAVGRERRFRIDSLVVESAAIHARVDADISASADRVELQWQRSRAVDARWASVGVAAGAFTTFHSGECTFHKDANDVSASVDCVGFATHVDVDSVEDRMRSFSAVARAVRSALDARDAPVRVTDVLAAAPATPTTGVAIQPSSLTTDAEMKSRTPTAGVDARATFAAAELSARANPPATHDAAGWFPQAFDVRARGGVVTVSHGEHDIVELRPASIRVASVDGRVRDAHLRFGDVAGPAIEVEVAAHPVERANGAAVTDTPAWRLDLNADELPLSELARWVPGIPWHGIDSGRTHARVRVEPSGGEGIVGVDGELSLEGFGLSHPRLSHEPIDGLNVTLRGATRIDVVRRRIETEGIRVGLNGISIGLAGWVERSGDHIALDTHLRLPAISCDSIRRALPRAVTGPVNEFVFAGTLEADAHLALDTNHLATTQLEVDVTDACAVSRDGFLQGVRRFGRPFVQRVQEPQGPRAFVTGPGSAAWVAIGEISPYLTRAVVMREDGGFFHHRGFNVPEIRGAIIRDVAARRFVYGASTISMQLAKNVFLAREKTLVRKIQEVALTWYLERSLDKDSILELYLNVVEFGPGIYGIGPAARFFFGREPRALTPLQAIYLSTLLPNPIARFANFQRGGVGAETLARLRGQARSMAQSGALSPAEALFAQSEALVFRPPGTTVVGALTYSVDPSISDAVAEANAPRRATVDEPGESSASENPDVDEPPVAPPDMSPVSLRSGGTI